MVIFACIVFPTGALDTWINAWGSVSDLHVCLWFHCSKKVEKHCYRWYNGIGARDFLPWFCHGFCTFHKSLPCSLPFYCRDFLLSLNMFSCLYKTGNSSFEVKIEADSNDITEHSHGVKPRLYLCMVCDKQFRMKGSLNQHKLIHITENIYSCAECGASFTNRLSLFSHLNIHRSKYKCPECGKCFRNSRSLVQHRRGHFTPKTPKTVFECTVCGKRFTQSAKLAKHSITCGEKKPYKCRECDKSFSQYAYLRRHMRGHTGDKPYKCSQCDKSFRWSSSLCTHKRHMHSNGRPHDCHYCGKRFKNSSVLKCRLCSHWCKAILM